MPETSALESSCSGILTFINSFDAPNFKFHFPTNSAKHLQTKPFIHFCRFDTTSGLPKIQRSIAFEKVWASLVCSQKLQINNLNKQTQHPHPPNPQQKSGPFSYAKLQNPTSPDTCQTDRISQRAWWWGPVPSSF